MTDQLAPPAAAVDRPEPAPHQSGVDRAKKLAIPRLRWRPEWRSALIAYVIPVGVTVLATTRWFSWGRFLAALDVPPLVRDSLATELTSPWSHQSTGAGSTGAPILQLPEVVLTRGVGLVGLPAPVAQWLLYALSFGLCTFGAAYLAGAWVRRPWAAAAAGLLATFNMYLLVWLPNPLPAVAIGLAGLLGGMVGRAAAGRRIRPVWFAAATVACSYLALNPPWLLMTIGTTLFVAVASAAVGGRAALGRAGWLLVRALPWLILFNLWWLVPLALQLLHPSGVALSAVTNIRDWSWTHNRTTLAGVLTLNAYWALPVPKLFPFAFTLGSGLRLHLQWVPPLLAFAGVVLAGRRRRAIAWLVAGTASALVFVSTGLRVPPIARVNLWLYDHVPGMWLLRDPASKLGVPLVLVYSALAALAIDRVIELSPRLSRISWPQWLPPRVAPVLPLVAVAGLVAAAVGNISPMWTGAVAPTRVHGEYPGSRVSVPTAWHGLADAVNAEPGPGKVLILPVSLDSYNVATTWGYRGVDNIPVQLLTRPAVDPLPGGYYDDVPAVRQLTIEAQKALLAGDTGAWFGALRALGVGDVVVRHDLKPASFDLQPSADPDQLDAALRSVDSMQHTGNFGVASLYRTPGRFGSVSANRQVIGVQGPDATAVADATAALPAGSVAVSDPTEPVTAFHGTTVDPGTMTFRLAHGGPYRLERDGGDAAYRVSVAGGRLLFTDADAVAVDGRALPVRPSLQMGLSDPRVLGLSVDGELRTLPAVGDVVAVGPNTTVTAYAAQPATGLSGPFQAAPECGGTVDGSPGADPLRLAVRSGKVCAMAPVQLTGRAGYRVHFAVRTTGGAWAHVCLWQDGPATCAPMPSPRPGSGWVDYTAIASLAPNAMSARLYLYADAVAGPGAAEYRDIDVTPLRAVGSARIAPTDAPSTTVTLAAGRHHITVNRQPPAPATTGSPEFTACTDPRSVNDRYPMVGRVPVQPDGDLLIDARVYGLCAQPEYAPPIVAGGTYRFAVDYRTSYGEDPRVCVREVSTQRCLAGPALLARTRWQHVEALVRPVPESNGLTPQLFADATYMVSGQVTYRHYSLSRVAPLGVRVSPEVPPPAADARIESERLSPTDYRVRVHGAGGRQLLVLPESYAPGWTPSGLPSGWQARHLLVDGYANGWEIDGTGDATFDLVYRPAIWSLAAIAGSGLAVATAILIFIVRRSRRSRYDLVTKET